MFYMISYYLNRVTPFMWLCILGIFVHSFVKERRKYLCGDIKISVAAARTLLLPYVLFLITLTVLIRLPDNEISFELMPFASYREIIRTGDKRLLFHNIGNIAIFIPYGFLLPASEFTVKGRKINTGRALASGMLFTLFVEFFQLVTRFGTFEIDDIINNFFGVAIGCVIFAVIMVFAKLINKKDDGI